MIGKTLGHYRIVGKLGKGGMGEVYVAEDAKLDRKVALKVLPEKMAGDQERRQRFEREAKAVAALNHPNIVTIHSVENAEGTHFITMELVQGKTLSELIPNDGMALSKLFDVAIPLADALATAHGQGITHRDLKPDNVMVTPEGRVKVLDFGLAKLREEASAPDGDSAEIATATVTTEGKILGTVAYMSPEQAEGKPIDQRSDIFALGILLYEMATGRRPFGGDTPISTISSILKDTPVSISELKETLPRQFGRVVGRCLEKAVDRRFQTALDVRNELEQLKAEVDSGELARAPAAPEPAAPRLGLWVGGGIVALLLLAAGWMFWWVQDRTDAPAPVAATSKDRSIAVVGFENLNDPQDAENLGRMLMSLVTTDLAESGGLEVISTAKVLAARRKVGSGGTGLDASIAGDAAREAGAEVMLVGQLIRDGEGMLLTAELVEVGRGSTLGSLKRQAASSSELFSLAGSIASDVRARLGVGADAVRDASFDLARTLTESNEAYRHFAAGELELHQRRYAEAAGHFERAVREDPSFAFAYYRMAIALSWHGERERCVEALRVGIEHAGRLPERWQVLMRAGLDYELGEADRAYETLSELIRTSPDMADAHNLQGELLTHYSRYRNVREAARHFETALEIDPTFTLVFFHLVDAYVFTDDPQALERLVASYREEGSDDTTLRLGENALLYVRGRYDELASQDESEMILDGGLFGRYYKESLVRTGRWKQAERVFDRDIQASIGYQRGLSLADRALLHVHRGRFRQALDDLGEAVALTADNPIIASMQGQVHAARALVLSWIHEEERAIEATSAIMGLDPYEIGGYYLVAYLNFRVGRLEEGERVVADYETTMERSRNSEKGCILALLRAEQALARGHPAEALAQTASLSRERCPFTWNAAPHVSARAHAVVGDKAAAITAYREVVDRPHPRPALEFGMWIPALFELAKLEEAQGDLAAARQHYERYLGYWGAADVAIPEVAEAKERLGRLRAP